MAENSGIAWTDHTFNPWIGCTKVGPGCEGCYAEVWNARFGAGIAPNWGAGAPRRRTTEQNWNKVRKWQREAKASGKRPRVFCASLADVFDNEVPNEWRTDLWALIAECPSLDWIIVTKRIGNVAKMAPVGGFPKNIIILATIVNQDEANRDVPKLLDLKVKGIALKVGVSCEPQLGPIDWTMICLVKKVDGSVRAGIHVNAITGRYVESGQPYLGEWDIEVPPPGCSGAHLDWIIFGGESAQGKHQARAFFVEWGHEHIRQTRGTRCAVFAKQMGSNPVMHLSAQAEQQLLSFAGREPGRYEPMTFSDKAGANPDEWPIGMNYREFPVIGDAP